MIIKSHYMNRRDGVELFINYSDAGKRIRQDQTGAVYDAAIDVATAPYTYTETDEDVESPVDPTPVEEQVSDSEALDILLGR